MFVSYCVEREEDNSLFFNSISVSRALKFDIPLVWCSIYIITVQVEELASLVVDNFPCKYLILSVEDMLVSYLQDDTR